MRIFIPATSADLTPAAITPRIVHTLTPELERVIGPEEPEFLEAIAMNAASDDSLRLVSKDTGAVPCRVVIAADVETVRMVEGEDILPTARYLDTPLSWDRVDSIHADGPELAAQIGLARAGDDDAFERVAEEDLMWYDVAERDLLARELAERIPQASRGSSR